MDRRGKGRGQKERGRSRDQRLVGEGGVCYARVVGMLGGGEAMTVGDVGAWGWWPEERGEEGVVEGGGEWGGGNWSSRTGAVGRSGSLQTRER